MSNIIPVIDVFSGPGGLGEGFASCRSTDGEPCFKIGLSVEKNTYAHSTLELRSFIRQFPHREAPEDYYRFLRGEISRNDLFDMYPEQASMAKQEAWLAELGSGPDFDNELDERIERIVGKNGKWVLTGGPPCQAYSVMGRARNSGRSEYTAENDERSYLYIEYLRILARHRPAVFVLENVKGLLSSRLQGHRIFDHIITDLQDPASVFSSYSHTRTGRYKIYSPVKEGDVASSQLKPEDFIVECEKFGIPQSRHRVILLGVREDLDVNLAGILKPSPAPVSAGEVLDDLPKLRSGLSREKDSPDMWVRRLREGVDRRWVNGAKNKWGSELRDQLVAILNNATAPPNDRGGEYVRCDVGARGKLRDWYLDARLQGVCNHTGRQHMLKDIYRYLFASCVGELFEISPKLQNFPADLFPDHDSAASGNFDDRFRVQLRNSPASTITSHISKDGHYYIHYDPAQCRSLTVREAARIQTFPDNYFFCGPRTQQYIQVGNAVPPYLAYQIAKAVHAELSAQTTQDLHGHTVKRETQFEYVPN